MLLPFPRGYSRLLLEVKKKWEAYRHRGCVADSEKQRRLGLFDYSPAQSGGQLKHRFLEVTVECHPVPAPLIPHGKQLLDVAQRFGGQFGPAGPVVRVVAHGLGLMQEERLARVG